MQPSTLTRARQWRALAAALCAALILPRIVQPGMFVDGVTYAVLARNLAEGVGSFWAPAFSTTVYPVFHEQPPFGIALQSLAFSLLGDHLFVERVFSIGIFALTALLVVLAWRMRLPREYDWLPLFFWVLPSIVTWAAINNMLEATQALWTTAAVLLLVHAVGEGTIGRSVWATGAAALAIVAAFLTKGPVGLFPLAVPPLALLLVGTERRSLTRVAMVWLALLLAVGAMAAVIASIPPARHALAEFASTHLVPALQGERGLPRRSFDIARHFTLGILARMAALALILWMIRPRGREIPQVRWNVAAFFFAVGLIASVPLLGSPVLAGHYFVPSVPFFALAVAAVSLPAVQGYRERSTGRARFVPAALAAGLVLLSVAVPVVRGPMELRDTALIAGVQGVGRAIPPGSTIGTCAAAAEDWGLHGYFQRFFRVSLAAGAPGDGWFVVRQAGCEPPPGCSAHASTGEITLFRCD